MPWTEYSSKYPLTQFLQSIRSREWIWYCKRLSGNDTQLTGSHQAGPYIPKTFVFDRFPSLKRNELNPRVTFPVNVVSHQSQETNVTAIWYNNKIAGVGTRDECRLTNWGGNDSPLLDPENTGALCIFAFHQTDSEKNSEICKIWVCTDSHQEDVIESEIGEVSPGRYVIRSAAPMLVDRASCVLAESDIPDAWRTNLPSGEELVEKCLSLRPEFLRLDPDSRLLKRRECEYEMFLGLEQSIILPKIRHGFNSVDEFIALANSVGNTRKTRSGKSLELHTIKVFEEERLTAFAFNKITEGNKRPDFIFPSAEAYHNPQFPTDKLAMLGVKTTCKDRWRQIMSEADRIPRKHLLTLQEGVSENQYAEMAAAGVTLVVPKKLHSAYPAKIREKLMGLAEFIAWRKTIT
ncbi:MAG: type II restriction endonuclease [Turneriella sp.]